MGLWHAEVRVPWICYFQFVHVLCVVARLSERLSFLSGAAVLPLLLYS